MIAIIDYGAGNLQSVEKAFRFIGAEIEITKDAERLREAEGVVLPGVGAFGGLHGIVEKLRAGAYHI